MNRLNSYQRYEPYWAYTKNTDEKQGLQQYVAEEFDSGHLPILKTDSDKHILDVGCGNGINTIFFAKLFKKNCIIAIDESPSQIKFAINRHKAENINYICLPLEKYKGQKFDFIIASHVLQYISINPSIFIRRLLSLSNSGGELWIIQQTERGMSEIINHQKPFLSNPLFKNWLTFNDYSAMVKKIANSKKITVKNTYLDTSFKSINFKNPSHEDKLRLEFILGLDKSFADQSTSFKQHLAKLKLGQNGKILHPNGIIKIRLAKK